MSNFLPFQGYAAGNPAAQSSEKSISLPSLDRGPPYIDEANATYRDVSYPWIVGRAFDQVPPVDIQPVRISASLIDGNKLPTFYVVIRGSRVGVLLDSVTATSFTNGVSDGHKFKTRSQVNAVLEFNKFNSLGQVKICPTRMSRPQVVITANWRLLCGMAVICLFTYSYLLWRASV